MESRDTLIRLLEHLPEEFELQNFFLPDGIAPYAANRGIQPYNRLLLVLDGKKNEPMSLDGAIRVVPLAKNDGYLVRRDVWEYCSFETPHQLFCIVPRGSCLRLSLYDLKEPAGHFPWPEPVWFHTARPCPESLESLFRCMAGMPDDRATLNHLIRSTLSIARTELKRECRSGEKSKADALFDRIQWRLGHEFSGNLTRQHLAGAFRITPEYVSRLFREKTGKTFQEYLRDRRLERAAILLKNTELSIGEIAEGCGFQDTAYFIRSFRKQNCCPPGRWRILYRNGDDKNSGDKEAPEPDA